MLVKKKASLILTVALFCWVLIAHSAASNTAQRRQEYPAQDSSTAAGAIVLNSSDVITSATHISKAAAVICNGFGWEVRQTSLVLEHLVLHNCSISLHGPGASLQAYNVTFHGNDLQTLGSVIWARDASISLHRVVFCDNNASTLVGPNLRVGRQPASGSYATHSTLQYYPDCNSSSDTTVYSYSNNSSGGACESPRLQTSLIYLNSSQAVISNSSISHNMADAMMKVEGSSPHAFHISTDTVISQNAAKWLLVADSWSHDPVGRAVIKTPQPAASSSATNLSFTPPYVVDDLMKRLRGDVMSDLTAARTLPDKYVGKASTSQTPLQLVIQDSNITDNSVSEGLLWLRLVNTSITNTHIVRNSAGSGLQAKHEPPPLQTTGSSVRPAAARHFAASAVEPPGPCDVVGALHGALIQVQAPAAFDIDRCIVDSNTHSSGAVIRVSQGAALTSIRSSVFSNNIATALLRVEGRSWVTDFKYFSEATEYLDSGAYTQLTGATKRRYDDETEIHRRYQEQQDRSVQYAAWYMTSCTLQNNTVFHSLIINAGNRTLWREYRGQVVQSKLSRAAAAVEKPTLDNACLAWWMVGCTVQGNRLVVPAIVDRQDSQGKAVEQWLNADQSACEELNYMTSDAQPSGQAVATASAHDDDKQHRVSAGGTYRSGNWSVALPADTAYTDALAYILSAGSMAMSNLSQHTNCSCILHDLLLRDKSHLARQATSFPRAPAVFWSSFGMGYLVNSNFANNTGFSHVLRMDNTMATMQRLNLESNSVATSVVNAWYADIWWHQGVMRDNSVVMDGSLLATESTWGHFKLISVTKNTAGTASSSAQDADALQCSSNSTPPRHHGMTSSSRNTNAATFTAAGDKESSGAAASSSICYKPIWRLSNLLNATLQDLEFTDNTGDIVLDIASFNTANSISNISIRGNRASGIRMQTTTPTYEGQPINLDNVSVTDNIQGSTQVGGLALGAFSSAVGTYMPINIKNCNFSNNAPASRNAQALSTLQLQGGGLRFNSPSDDSTNGQHGFLTSVLITVAHTTIADNVAAEGGGIWSAWPFMMDNCTITRNWAVNESGGGMYLRGLQKDTLALGTVVATNTRISGNCARFGGGIACENCRAVLAVDIANNSATTHFSSCCNGSAAAAVACAADSSGEVSSSCDVDSTNQRMDNTVAGAGGGIAANMASSASSYLLVCGNSNSSSGSNGTRGMAAGLAGNHADKVGGAVYLNATLPAAGCAASWKGFPQGVSFLPCKACVQAVSQASSKLAQGNSGRDGQLATSKIFSKLPCGVTLYDVAWDRSFAAAGGDLVALAQQPQPLQQQCPDSSVPVSTNTSTVSADWIGFQVISCSANQQGHSRQETAAAAPCPQCQVEDFSDTQRVEFHFPHRLFVSVYDTSCLEEQAHRNTSIGLDVSVCEVPSQLQASSSQQQQQGQHGQQQLPQVFAGQPIDFAVRIFSDPGTAHINQAHFHQAHANYSLNQQRDGGVPGQKVPSADLGTIVLHQRNQNVFVVGNQSIGLDSRGVANFVNMSMQPVAEPLGNKEYTFSFGPDIDDALLRQAQPVDVTVKVLRCTTGQYMTVNRCVNCSENGTYSLHPRMQCLPCPQGGNCTKGLVVAKDDFYSYDPLVPQVIPCPNKLGCRGVATEKDVQLLLQQLGLLTHQPTAAATHAAAMRGRLLQQQGAAAAQSASNVSPSSNSKLNKFEASYRFQQALAEALTFDTETGEALLMHVNYKALLDSWHKLQCSEGYTGNFCAKCDSNSTSLFGNSTNTTRYGFYLSKCISCKEGFASWAAVTVLYFVWCGYLAFGILMQLKAPRLCATFMSGSVLDSSRVLAALQESKSVTAAPAGPAEAAAAWPVECEAGGGTQEEAWTAASPSVHTQQQQQQKKEGLLHVVRPPAAALSDAPHPINQHHHTYHQQYQQQEHETELVESPFQQGDHQPQLQRDQIVGALAPQLAIQQSVDAGAGVPANQLTPALSLSAARGAARTMLVAIWKILTSYVQVIAMVRHLRLPLPLPISLIVTGPDVSSVTSLLSLDCLLPGPAWTHPYARIMLTSVGLPIMLLITALLAWIAAWCVMQLAAGVHAWRDRSTSQSLPAAGTTLMPDVEPGPVAVQLGIASSVGGAQHPAEQSLPGSRPGRSPSSWQQLRQQLGGWNNLLGGKLYKVPVWTAARLQHLGVSAAPAPLKQYLSLRMLVTVVVLCYSCYPLVTSSMLQALACESIGDCTGDQPRNPDLVRYGTLHRSWTAARNTCLSDVLLSNGSNINNKSICNSINSSSSTQAQLAGVSEWAPVETGLTCGYFWRQDYNVRCREGGHVFMTVYGAVGLSLLGLLLPLLVGVMLWRNRQKLRERNFAQKYSFLYGEYHQQYCFWEVVIIARKLLFLAATTLLPMTQASLDIATLQLQIGVMLAIICLVCQEILQPFSSSTLNRLERVGLTATALSYSLFVCANVVRPEAKMPLLIVLAVLNVSVIGFFLYNIGCLLWALHRERVAQWLRVARLWAGVWCRRRGAFAQRHAAALRAAGQRGLTH